MGWARGPNRLLNELDKEYGWVQSNDHNAYAHTASSLCILVKHFSFHPPLPLSESESHSFCVAFVRLLCLALSLPLLAVLLYRCYQPCSSSVAYEKKDPFLFEQANIGSGLGRRRERRRPRSFLPFSFLPCSLSFLLSPSL